MVDMTQVIQTTDAVVARAAEANQSRRTSTHLGASALGAPCDREVWYGFRGIYKKPFEARMLELFEAGHDIEDRVIKALTAAGFIVHYEDASTKYGQIGFDFAYGHGVCYVDGVGAHFPEAPEKWHNVEVKSMSDKNFKKWIKTLDGPSVQSPSALEKDFPKYATQMRVAMRGLNLERTMFIVVNKDTSAKRHVRYKAEPRKADADVARAERIIASDKAPPRIADKPDAWACKWCDYKQHCHGNQVANVNCRTCTESSPRQGGGWHCRFHETMLDEDTMRSGCTNHMFNPSLFDHWLEPIDGSPEGIHYKNRRTGHAFINGPREITSVEMFNVTDPNILGDVFAEKIRDQFPGATYVG